MTTVYSIPEDFYELFLNTIRMNVAPWMNPDIMIAKAQVHESEITLIDERKKKETKIPLMHIIEIGRLE
jgi:hypothetical protein